MRGFVPAFTAMLLVAACALPSTALAEVRKADVIAGMSVEARDLSVAECPSVDAEYAALVDADGNVFFERNASGRSRIASITKVMTAIVALDNAAPDTKVTVSEAAATIGESSANLVEGDELDLDTALKALLVPSGNDAALAIAETVGGQIVDAGDASTSDPVQAFVDAMNAKAEQIGCEDTVYTNPHGLDDGEYDGSLHSTALDQTKVASCAMGYDKIREIVSGGSTTVKVKRDGGSAEVELETTDLLLDMYEYAIGVKTGVTDSAGPSFMGAASKDGRELYAVVLGSADEYQRFVDAENLFEWAYDHVIDLSLANTDEYATMGVGGSSREVPVVAAVSHPDWIDKTVPATLADPDASISVFDLEGNVSQSVLFDEVSGTVREGDKVGSIVFKQRNQVVAEQDLVAAETVYAPNPIEGIQIWWERLTNGPQDLDVTDSEIYNVMPIILDNRSNAA